MAAPKSYEARLLAKPMALLAKLAGRGPDATAIRLEILEAVASRLGGFLLDDYRAVAGGEYALPAGRAIEKANPVLDLLRDPPIHPALALCSLARAPLPKAAQRTTGAYYTDFRLARFLAEGLPADPDRKVVDLASGTGILLVAQGIRASGPDRHARTHFVAESACGADLSAAALRGAALALAALTDDVDAVRRLLPRLRCQDSLLAGPDAWRDVAPSGIPSVIGNPPWEKLKVNRHEFMADQGEGLHYGADYRLSDGDAASLARRRERVSAYARRVARDLDLQGSGEPDLYKAFIESAFRVLAPGGDMALLLPAGLIRSQGTTALREHLFESASRLDITVVENRARFFAIDTRQKFLAVHAALAGDAHAPLVLRHGTGTESGVDVSGDARIGRTTLRSVRPDLSIPEVRGTREWTLFRHMVERGTPLAAWNPRFSREVDMSRDREHFVRESADGAVPVVEGRMVHQHRFGAKAHVSGTGRRAVWRPVELDRREVKPQYWVSAEHLRREARERTARPRIGFCDVTGQTNERSLLAARIPEGVVCGNKVPTILFDGDPADPDALEWYWLAVANSIPVDWMLRRVLTTTINYFILEGVAFPTLEPSSLPARRLASLASALDRVSRGEEAADLWTAAEWRAEIDVRVLCAYGLDTDALELMLGDFPLLDRGQPALKGEERSTVTRDLLLARAADSAGNAAGEFHERLLRAREIGAIPYVPAEFAKLGYPPTRKHNACKE